jgi:hypothetical protein
MSYERTMSYISLPGALLALRACSSKLLPVASFTSPPLLAGAFEGAFGSAFGDALGGPFAARANFRANIVKDGLIQAEDAYNYSVIMIFPRNQRVSKNERKTEEAEDNIIENHDGP